MKNSAGSDERKVRCDLCGRLFPMDELTPSDNSGTLLCLDCLAEEKNCGCADE